MCSAAGALFLRRGSPATGPSPRGPVAPLSGAGSDRRCASARGEVIGKPLEAIFRRRE